MPTEDAKLPEAPQTPIPLAAFSAMLRPQLTATRTVRSRQPGAAPTTIPTYAPGHPDEIWLKLLAVRHGIERHTPDEWHALIDSFRDEPAHPADIRFGG